MILIVNGEIKNPNVELEIFNEEFGFDCVIGHKSGRVEIRHNCTEFHHGFCGDEASAFESDIHCTGGTKDWNKLDYIIVMDAKIKHSNY